MTTQVAVNDTLTQAVVKEDFIQKRKFYLAIGFLMCLIMGLVYAWSIFVLPLEKQFGWTRAQTQLTFTLTIIMFSFGNIVGGRLADRFGPRMVASAGAVLTTIGFFLAWSTTSLVMLYFSYGILVGFGIGVAYICVISLAARWYPDQRGLAAGVVTMGFGLAGFLLGGIVGYFINSLGWQWAFRTLGLASARLNGGRGLIDPVSSSYLESCSYPE